MKLIECVQGSPEWWEARRGVPTCSEFGRILTPVKRAMSAGADDYIAELIADRVCLTPNYFTDRATNRDMQHGTNTEPEARRFYEMDRNTTVFIGTGRSGTDPCALFYLDDEGRFGGSPDGLIGDEGGLELKCPKRSTQVEYLLAGTLPDEYKAQVHGHLIVSKRPWWDFMSYAPGLEPFLIRVVPDAFTRELRVALEVFWEKYQATWKRISGGKS